MRLSDRLRAQYPEEMTIVLQHQFWDLKVSDDAFEVGLSFGGVAERLVVPFEAIKAFADPSVQFTLQFETLAGGAGTRTTRPSGTGAAAERPIGDAPPEERGTDQRSGKPAARRGHCRRSAGAADKPGDKGGAEVVRLDRFRKK